MFTEVIGTINDFSSAKELSEAHTRVYQHHFTVQPPSKSNHHKETIIWVEQCTKIMNEVVEELTNGDPERSRKINNVLAPVRKTVSHYSLK